MSLEKSKKDRFKEFAKKESLPIYMQPWWQDVVAKYSNLEWDVLLFESGGQIWASFVYTYKVKFGLKIIITPNFTNYTGLFIKYPPGQKVHKKLSWDKKIMQYFIEKLPKYDKLLIDLSPAITNWLPFYWAGFKDTTRYTYIIEDLSNLDDVYREFDHMARNNIKKAQKYGVEVVESDDIDEFYNINKITFEKQNMEIPYSKEFIEAIYKAGKKENSVKILFAKKDSRVYSVSLAFYDDNFVYILASGSDRNINTYGAEYLLFWEMMKYASENGLAYDFEGSIIEGVEKRNRVFGASQHRYFRITKYNSKLLELIARVKGDL